MTYPVFYETVSEVGPNCYNNLICAAVKTTLRFSAEYSVTSLSIHLRTSRILNNNRNVVLFWLQKLVVVIGIVFVMMFQCIGQRRWSKTRKRREIFTV